MALGLMAATGSLTRPATASATAATPAVVSRRAGRPMAAVRCTAAKAAASVPGPPLVRIATCGLGQQRQGERPRPRRGVVAASQKQQFSSFEDMLDRSDVPVLVDFYATWCGPCQMMSPALAAVASKFKGRLQVVKIDTDKYPAIASKHKVQALPTIGLFVGGKMVFRFEGVLQEPQLTERLNYYLAGAGARKQ